MSVLNLEGVKFSTDVDGPMSYEALLCHSVVESRGAGEPIARLGLG